MCLYVHICATVCVLKYINVSVFMFECACLCVYVFTCVYVSKQLMP